MRLRAVTGPHRDEEFAIATGSGGSTLVGRGKRCGISLARDPCVSIRHARLDAAGAVTDLGSMNGLRLGWWDGNEAHWTREIGPDDGTVDVAVGDALEFGDSALLVVGLGANANTNGERTPAQNSTTRAAHPTLNTRARTIRRARAESGNDRFERSVSPVVPTLRLEPLSPPRVATSAREATMRGVLAAAGVLVLVVIVGAAAVTSRPESVPLPLRLVEARPDETLSSRAAEASIASAGRGFDALRGESAGTDSCWWLPARPRAHGLAVVAVSRTVRTLVVDSPSDELFPREIRIYPSVSGSCDGPAEGALTWTSVSGEKGVTEWRVELALRSASWWAPADVDQAELTFCIELDGAAPGSEVGSCTRWRATS